MQISRHGRAILRAAFAFSLLALTSLPAILAPGAASAEERAPRSYRDFVEAIKLRRFHEAPAAERDQLRLLYKVSPARSKDGPLVLTIGGAHPVQLTPDASGSIEIPYDAALLAENPPVRHNLPEGEKLSLSLDLRPRLPDGPDIPYDRLMAAISQANGAIRKEAGMLSMFVPSLDRIVLAYPPSAGAAGGAVATLGAGAGARSWHTDKDGKIVLPLDKSLLGKGLALHLSAMPADIDFGD